MTELAKTEGENSRRREEAARDVRGNAFIPGDSNQPTRNGNENATSPEKRCGATPLRAPGTPAAGLEPATR